MTLSAISNADSNRGNWSWRVNCVIHSRPKAGCGTRDAHPLSTGRVRRCPAASHVDHPLTRTPEALPPRREKGPLTCTITRSGGRI